MPPRYDVNLTHIGRGQVHQGLCPAHSVQIQEAAVGGGVRVSVRRTKTVSTSPS